ncbi:hypothetical protein LXT21_37555 [Myxococcus sp. K38C18041901]|uniref:hypothetical protein n=1 Tax=Myxococcus guangdongensis TaxID=2906760 RepID=UPI0020A7561A|nr:hypothetical protein [Myxococcus guangdongensis]MCP3064496.1 hypothetical protein [Myxococcus guangdongensis]
MRTTGWWKVAVMCGSLAASGALARSTTLAEPTRQPDMTAPQPSLTPPSPEELFAGAPDEMAPPRLRHVEPVACASAPEGRLWVASTEECGDTECVDKTTVWVGSWTVEDTTVEVQCDADRIILSTFDWKMVLIPDGKGDFDVEESVLGDGEVTPVPTEHAQAEPVKPGSQG